MFKKIIGKITPLRLAVAVCCLIIGGTALFIFVNNNHEEGIADDGVPLTAFTYAEGDLITLRIAAPEVSDLYGYQFRLEYDDTLFSVGDVQSLIADIPMIFKKNFDGYVLVGATMTGESPGYSASDTQLCELNLTALTDDGKLPEVNISKVSVVSSELDYTEDVSGWTYEVTANKSAAD